MSFSQRRPRITLTRLNQRPLRDFCFAVSMRIGERVRRQGNFAWRRRPWTLFCRGNENISTPGTQIQPKQDTTSDDEKYGQKVEQQRQRSLHPGAVRIKTTSTSGQPPCQLAYGPSYPSKSLMSLAPPRAKTHQRHFVRHPEDFCSTICQERKSHSFDPSPPRASIWLRWSFGQPGLPQSFFVSREVFGTPIRAHHVFESGNT